MKKAGCFIIAIITLIIPVILAVNIIRTEVNGKDDKITTYEVLAKLSQINVSFSATYLQIAEAGVAWQKVAGSITAGDNQIGTNEDGQIIIGDGLKPHQTITGWLTEVIVTPVLDFFKGLFTGQPTGDFTLSNWFTGFINGLTNFFNALWQSICIPFVFIGEACQMIYDCIYIFVDFVGFIPGKTDTGQ